MVVGIAVLKKTKNHELAVVLLNDCKRIFYRFLTYLNVMLWVRVLPPF
jgi:hypothetical protein